MISKIFAQFIKHKIVAGIILIIIAVGGYLSYRKIFSNNSIIRYVTAKVQRGTLIISITGSGYVSASNQVDVKSKVGGEIITVYTKPGQEVGAGAILAAIDSRDAERAVRDAEIALETAKLELDKMLEPIDALTLLQAENSLIQAKESKQKAEDNLKKAYEEGFNTVSNAFLDLPNIMAGLQDILFSSSLGGGSQWNIDFYTNEVKAYDDAVVFKFRDDVYAKYRVAREAYDKNFADYKSASRFSDRATIEKIINQTYETTKLIAEALKSTNNLIQFYQDKLIERNLKPVALSDAHLRSLSSYTGTTNNHLLSLLSTERSIQDSNESLLAADRTIQERTLYLEKIKKGPDSLDIRAKKIAIQQKEDALTTAKQALADHYVRAPFAGIIAKVNAKKGDTASVGTTIATLVAKQKIAEVSLNEVDVAKVKVGQKATLTFDAIPDLTVTGQVIEVDAVGTISQGVVTYTVKIGFDTQDGRIKPGMSVSASIVIEAKPNVLLVPNSAIKSQGGMSYVEIFDNNNRNSISDESAGGVILKNSPPRRQSVEIGTANDEFTEILSGLSEGDVIVTRIIQPNSTQLQTQQQSGVLRIPSLPGRTSGGWLRGSSIR